MNREDLLKYIAEMGYNVGFGAKKHYATYDIVEKTPGIISFVSMAFGIYALSFDGLSTNFLSSTIIIIGIIGLYISCYGSTKNDYEQSGTELTQLFNELSKLYGHVKNCDENMLEKCEDDLKDIESRYYKHSLTKQILFSDWYAHYKFFWQHQIDWVNEEKKFKFFRDKIPLSFIMAAFSIVLIAIFLYSDWIVKYGAGVLNYKF